MFYNGDTKYGAHCTVSFIIKNIIFLWIEFIYSYFKGGLGGGSAQNSQASAATQTQNFQQGGFGGFGGSGTSR